MALLIDDYLRGFAASEGTARDRLRLATRAASLADRVFEEQGFSRQVAAVERLAECVNKNETVQVRI